jgi:hypothetical protein
MSENSADQARFAELEAQLQALLREKYRVHWRRKDGKPIAADEQERLAALQAKIKEVFDAIRLIDRKYKIPPQRLREDPASRP